MGRRLPLISAISRGPQVTLTVDGRPVRAHAGESVVAVLLAEGHAATRTTPRGEPRGLYCGMGVCFECLVVVDGIPNTRACMTWAREGMRVESQDGVLARSVAAASGAASADGAAPAGGPAASDAAS
ncbi:MAG TPA: (2Fe-2S)-binding protein [Conexibacter sp.]|jgi:predicted molibdopterin-dependent oxidoreductase YjgC